MYGMRMVKYMHNFEVSLMSSVYVGREAPLVIGIELFSSLACLIVL